MEASTDARLRRHGIPDYLLPTIDPALVDLAKKTLGPLRLQPDGEWTAYAQFRGPVGYVASKPVFAKFVERGNALVVSIPRPPDDAVAIFHTHPRTGNYAEDMANLAFGPGDADVVYQLGVPHFLKNSAGGISVLQMTPMGPMPTVITPPRRADLPRRFSR